MSGLGHIFNGKEMVGMTEQMGVPLASLAVPLTGVMILLGGLSIILGYKTKIGALLIIIFLVPVSFIMHPFWKIPDPMQAQINMIMFMKNISMTGAALIFYYFGSGPLSLDKESKNS
jgi:putative oxidoreductase